MAHVVTMLASGINPEVIGARLEVKLTDMIKFSPLARVGYDLQGRAGNTITVPYFEYIGDATEVAEGVAIEASELTASTYQATVIKAGQAVEITDEAMLSAWGDVMGEAESQLGLSIASKIDADCLTALDSATMVNVNATFGKDVVVDGLLLFGEDINETTALIIPPSYLATLRKDADFVHVLNGEIKITGTVGQIYGTNVVVSNKLTDSAFLVRAGGLGLEFKRGVNVEADRDILRKTTVISADSHYVAYLRDANKVVKLAES